LFDALDDEWLANEEIKAAHVELMGTIDELVRAAQETGEVRPDVSGVDVMMMVKGVCEAARSFQHVDPELRDRQLDLVRAALSTPSAQRPLRGRLPTLDDLELPASAEQPISKTA
jgi:Transcriptional regulator SbtR-like, C-terminal domain